MSKRSSSLQRLSTPTIVKLVLVVLLLVCGVAWLVYGTVTMAHTTATTDAREGFRNAPTSSAIDVSTLDTRHFKHDRRHTPDTMYDASYVKLYRAIIDAHRKKVIEFEVSDLIQRTNLKAFASKAVVLDIGCGTGTHLLRLAKRLPRAQLYGLDQSQAMLDVAAKRLGQRARFLQADFNDDTAVHPAMCTHATCYYFSVYYADRPQQFFDNVYTWLQPKGYLCVHVVDPLRFDPVPEAANPIRGISLQRYFDKRKTDATIVFEHMVYKCDFTPPDDEHHATLKESLIYPTRRHVREHTHELRMPPHENLVHLARKSGFRLRHVTQLMEIGEEYEYLCYFQRD